MAAAAWRVGVVAAFLAAGAEARAAQRNWAQGLFHEQGHDFGAVPRGAVVRHPFVLTNRLAEPVTILDVRASCGCTTGRAPADQVGPGQQAVVEAVMDTRNFVGVKATTLTVTLVTASGRQAEARLGVRSNILSDIVLNPGTLDFGAPSRGQPAEMRLTIDRHGAPGWRIERMLASRRLGQAIEATLEEAYRAPQGVGYALTVKVRPDAPAGAIREEIQLRTNDPETPVVPVLVNLDVRGRVTASPALLTLAPGAARARVLIRGTEPFAISGVEGAGEGLDVAGADGVKKALHVLTIALRPDAAAAPGRRTLRVATDLPGEPPVEVQAIVAPGP
jgi:hypothetical protein